MKDESSGFSDESSDIERLMYSISMMEPWVRLIQNYYYLYVEEYRGDRFLDCSCCNVNSNNDMLSDSNLIGTNKFVSMTIAMADYNIETYVYKLNNEGDRDEITTAKDPTKPRFVVGAIGPSANRTGSMSPSVADLSARNFTVD